MIDDDAAAPANGCSPDCTASTVRCRASRRFRCRAPHGDVVRGLREVIDAGAEMILLNPVGEHVAEDREQMERLAADVIPQLS